MSHFKGEIRVNREEERNVALLSLFAFFSSAGTVCDGLFFFSPDRQNAFVVLSVEFSVTKNMWKKIEWSETSLEAFSLSSLNFMGLRCHKYCFELTLIQEFAKERNLLYMITFYSAFFIAL